MTEEAHAAATLVFYEDSAALYADQWNNPAMMSDPRARLMTIHPAPARLLDVGCGTGRDARAFS